MTRGKALGIGLTAALATAGACQMTYIDVGSNLGAGDATTTSGTSSTTSTSSTTTTTTTTTEPCALGLDGGSSVWSSQYGPVPPIPVGTPISVAVDVQDNVVVAGSFGGSIDLGCGPLTGTTKGASVFVAKLDPGGGCLWSKGFSTSQGVDGGPVGAGAAGVAVDASNNVVLMGAFSGSIEFGSNQLTGGGMFVAKLDPTGALLWSTGFSGSVVGGNAPGIAVDTSGNVLLLGALFGSVDVAGQALTSPPDGTNLVIKLDPGGVPTWGRTFDASSNAFPSGGSIAVDASGNVLLTGEFQGSADFGCGASLTGSESAFVAKLDPGGACVWAKGFVAATSTSFGSSVAAAAGGQVVVTGSFTGPGSVDFGNGPVAGMADGNLFVATFDASGALVWAKAFGVSGNITGEGVTVDAAGDVLATGIASGSVDFGGGTLTSAGAGGDVFVASFDGDGTLRWARLFGAPAAIESMVIAVDPTCHVLVAGDFKGVLDFGGNPLPSAAAHDVFVAELVR